MIRRKLIIPLVALATMALMLSATGASAKPHETVGELVGTCDVDGTVFLDGLDNNPSNNHYQFQQTTLECDSDDAKLAGDYDVDAEGDTADYWHQDPNGDEPFGGEDCAQGGSAKEGDEVHSGVLTATALTANTNDLQGKVHFVRLAEVVLADGPLWEAGNPNPAPNDPLLWFQAELVFQPTQGDCFDKQNPVTAASLTGTAEIYAGNSLHDCGLDNEKVNDKDCDKLT